MPRSRKDISSNGIWGWIGVGLGLENVERQSRLSRVEPVPKTDVQLPRGLTQQQVGALWTVREGSKPRDLRNRALQLLFLRLGLRTEEVASLPAADIDWSNGNLKVRSAKTCRVRTLPLAQDVSSATSRSRPH